MLFGVNQKDVEAMKGKDKKVLIKQGSEVLASSKWFWEGNFPSMEKWEKEKANFAEKKGIDESLLKVVIITRVSRLNPIKYYMNGTRIIGRYQP